MADDSCKLHRSNCEKINQRFLILWVNRQRTPATDPMTKNLGNAKPNAPAREIKNSPFGRIAPALFPLVVVVLGYLLGKQFFGF